MAARKHLYGIFTLKNLLAPASLSLLAIILAISLPLLAPFDRYLTDVITSIPSAKHFMLAISSVGQGAPLIITSLIVAGIAMVYHRTIHGWIIMASLLSIPTHLLIKEIVGRARPVTEFVAETGLRGYSFPSGHTTASTAVYGVLAYLAYRDLPKPWNVIVAAILVALIFLIGISRVYLGAHFPTDVVGGWLIGTIFIIILVTILKLSEAAVR